LYITLKVNKEYCLAYYIFQCFVVDEHVQWINGFPNAQHENVEHYHNEDDRSQLVVLDNLKMYSFSIVNSLGNVKISLKRVHIVELTTVIAEGG
jgi:hypothetical protein